MATQFINSPIGTLLLESDGSAVRRIEAVKKMGANDPDAITKKCAMELVRYFAGKSDEFSVPMEAEGTAFQKAVWNAMKKIPHGKTKTYGEVAKAVGRPAAVRAVGTACGANPLLVAIPCHRIVGSNGGLGGFSAGIDKKEWLLEHESAE